MMDLPLDRLVFDEDCQSRVKLDANTVADYANALRDGSSLPPVTAVFDGSTYLLCDGFHRWAAHKAMERDTIAVEVVQGCRLDAVKMALLANARHGKRREPGDYVKGYDIAVRCGLCAADDAAAVQRLLACSERWARDLTAPARALEEQKRNARIVAARGEGKTVREVAAAEGVDPATVSRVAKRQPAEMQQSPASVGNRQIDKAASVNGGQMDGLSLSSVDSDAAGAPTLTGEFPHMAGAHLLTVSSDRPGDPTNSADLPSFEPPPSSPISARPPPGLSNINTPDSMAWSDLNYWFENTVAACAKAMQHTCPVVMRPRLERECRNLRSRLAQLEETINAQRP